tara:strand:+ start:452 stop:1078 length:627 start_codon:yes stop_codon:yes gene_type:complete
MMTKNDNKGLVLVISSPSGAGKTTICKKLIDQVDGIDLSVSVTTRKKRKDEIDGKHYFFTNKDKFRKLLKENQFLEYANVFGCLYGTLKNEVVSKIDRGTDVIVDIDWQGTRQIEKQLPKDIVKVFILPPSMRELENRLGKRASENKENFKKRMSEAKKEISHYKEYDFVIVNNDLQIAVDQIKLILFSERLRINRHLALNQTIEKIT